MRKVLLLLTLALAGAAQPEPQRARPAAVAAAASPRRTILFDADWKFHRGGAQYAEQPGFDDASWRQIDLPHDWSIEDLEGTQSPFDRDAAGQVSTGFTTGGTGWYRKTFSVPDTDK